MTRQDDKSAYQNWRTNVFKQKYLFNEDGSGYKDTRQCIEWEAWKAALEHERQLKPVVADDLIRRSDVHAAVDKHIKESIEIMNTAGFNDTSDLLESIDLDIFKAINTIPAISNTVEAVVEVTGEGNNFAYVLYKRLPKGIKLYAAPQQAIPARLTQDAVRNIFSDWKHAEETAYGLYDRFKRAELLAAPTAPPQSQAVKDALEAAAKLLDDRADTWDELQTHGSSFAGELRFNSKAIRALITDTQASVKE
ncbi:MAG: hypothetical protein V4605_03365 [Pseudomonadota bacterium]